LNCVCDHSGGTLRSAPVQGQSLNAMGGADFLIIRKHHNPCWQDAPRPSFFERMSQKTSRACQPPSVRGFQPPRVPRRFSNL